MARVPSEAFAFCGPTYNVASPVIDAERSINLYPEPEYRSAKTPMALIGRPGLVSPAFMTLPTSPARGLWSGANRMFATGGNHYYEISSAGTVITDFGAMIGSAGKGPTISQANGTQLLVCDPQAGNIYNAVTIGPTLNVVFNGVALEYVDGFYVAIATGGSLAGANPNQLNVSAFQDGTTWPGLGFAIRTSAADLIIGMAYLNSFLWVFGQSTITVYYNAGTPNFPFARVTGADINLGCMAAASIVKFYNTVMWVGAGLNGYPQVYMAQGLNPVRVSNYSIEQILGSWNQPNLSRAWAYGYQEAGHTFYCLRQVDENYTPIQELVYDLTSGLWHERNYTAGFWPVSFASCAGFAPAFNPGAANLVGDGLSGRIAFQNISAPSDVGGIIQYARTTPHVADQNEWIVYNKFTLDTADMGTTHPFLQYSNNGGVSFLSWTYDLRNTGVSQGTQGGFRRYFANQLGRSRDRVFSVAFSSQTDLIRIINGYLDVN